MKKTILALTVPALLAVSAFANASTQIYKTDNQSLDLFGRAFVYMSHKDSNSNLHSSTRLGLKGKTKVNDSLDAFFRTSWQLVSTRAAQSSNTGSGDNLTSRYQFVGLDAHKYGQIKFGQFFAAYDLDVADVGDIMEYGGAQGIPGTYGWNFNSNAIEYENTFGPVKASLTYQLSTTDGTAPTKNDDGTTNYSGSYDGVLNTYQIDDNAATQEALSKMNSAYAAAFVVSTGTGFKVHFGASRQNFAMDAHKTGYAVATTYSEGEFYAAARYNYDKTSTDQRDAKRQGFGLAAQYRMDQIKLLGSYEYGKQSGGLAKYNKKFGNHVNVGVNYYLTSNVYASAEIDRSLEEDSNEYYAGLKYNF